MTSVSSRGRSPHSPYDFDSAGETDDSWQYLEYASSGPASIGFLPSPASGSLNGYAIVGQVPAASPAALSPLYLDLDQPAFPTTSFDQAGSFTATSAPTDAHFIPGAHDADQFLTPGGYLFSEEQLNDISPFGSFPSNMPLTGLESFDSQQQQQLDLGIPHRYQSPQAQSNVPPWNPTNLKADLTVDDFFPSSHNSASTSPYLSGSTSPDIKHEGEKSSTPPSPIRKVKGSKVEKKKNDQAGKFVIVTPTSINANAGSQNPFECFDAMRSSQRGRKGPLANSIKQSALQVRRLGACFCCHSRKVKCDKERPCKNCKKIMVQVPQVVCWQFQDFLTVLFPDFIRSHFRKDQMSKFMSENVEGLSRSEQTYPIELFSGPRFSTVLTVKGKFFTPKTAEVQQHWHLQVGDKLDLQARGTAPLGIELENQAQREELRKKAKEYIYAITSEPGYAEQVTDAFRHTDLPKTILTVIQKYAIRSDSPIVKKALSIYGAHYVMTRHLCLTKNTIINLQQTNLVPSNVPWVTPRVLNRQVKSVIDELLMREMQLLFESFSKSLKPKSRREWAPCLAAFLVLCLFMEAVETAADTFVLALNEISMRNKVAPEFKRQVALDVNREVENMPFKQFAYQFHQIYQTHSKDASTKSFNPLMDDSFVEQGEVDEEALEMVATLKELIQGSYWSELDFLTMDPILPNQENHPFPRDISLNYTGRLVAKFLLSFTDEKYIFGSGI